MSRYKSTNKLQTRIRLRKSIKRHFHNNHWHSAQDMMAMIVMPFVPGRTAQAAMDDNESDAALGLGLGLPVLCAAQAKPSGRPCTW